MKSNHIDLKRRPRVAKLRRELAALIWQLRRDRRMPQPDVRTVLCDAFRRGLKNYRRSVQKIASLDIGATNPKSGA